MSRVGQIRQPRWPLVEWCETTLDKEVIPSAHYLLCFNDASYCRLFCLDNGKTYHMTLDSFDVLTDEVK